MKVEEFVVQMKKTLIDERNAIRTMNAKGVLEASLMKEALLGAINESAQEPEEKQALLAALKALKPELRRNLILLAHARDYIREAVAFVTARPRLQASL